MSEEEGIFDDIYELLFSKSWNMWAGAMLLSVLSICLFIIANPWGSSGGLLNWGQNGFDFLGLSFPESTKDGSPTNILDHRFGLLSLTMLLGAMASAMLAREFAVRIAPAGELVKGFTGGILMGVGAVIGMGCTIGGFYSAWPALSGGGIIFVLGLAGGVFAAVKYILWEMEAHPEWSSGKSYTYCAANDGESRQPLYGLLVLLVGLGLVWRYDGSIATEQKLLGFAVIGLLIGLILQRSRFCVVRALREPFLSGDSKPAQALMGGLLVGLAGFVVIKYYGVGSETAAVASNFWFPALLGGLIFGFGMTIAGGCTVGATWRAGEGHVKLWLALLGLIISLPLAAEYLKPPLLDILPAGMQQGLFLPDTFGYLGGIMVILLVIPLWYLFVRWNEKTGRFAAF